MKKDRQELENTLRYVIDENAGDRRQIKNDLIKKMTEYNISAGKTIGFWQLTIAFNTISNAELYLFTKSLFEITSDFNINPKDWFNDEEIKSYEIYKAPEDIKSDVVIFYNVDQVSEKQWICSKETYVDWSKKASMGFFTYNVRTQRETTRIIFNNKMFEIPTIKQAPIMEMTALMVTGKFTPNTVTLNIRKTGSETPPEYDKKNRSLAIAIDNEESFLDIIDGQHRGSAFIKTVEQKPDTAGFTFISFLYYSEEEAQEYIDQEDHRTPISKTHLEGFKNSDSAVIITKSLNTMGNETNNVLFNKIANDYNGIEYQGQYVTIETFAKALRYNFKIEYPREVSKVTKFLKDFYNELIGIILEKDKIKIKNNMFLGFMALAEILYDKENWREILENININEDTFKSLDLNTQKITTVLIKKFYDKMKETVIVNV